MALPGFSEIPAEIQSSQAPSDQNNWAVQKHKVDGTERSDLRTVDQRQLNGTAVHCPLLLATALAIP